MPIQKTNPVMSQAQKTVLSRPQTPTPDATSFTSFFQAAFVRINFVDNAVLVVKSAVYGFTIGFAGCFNGFYADHGTVGVGRAANTSVVVSMFLIFIEEMLIVQLVHNYLR